MSKTAVKASTKKTTIVKRGKNFLNDVKKHPELYLMIIPAVVFFLIFSYIPMVGIVMAFKDFRIADGIFGSDWCGLKNFEFFFSSGTAWRLTKNTMLYNIAFLVVNVFLEVLIAVFISELGKSKLVKFCQSAMLLPHFISWVVVAVFLFGILNYETGSLNALTFQRRPFQRTRGVSSTPPLP